MNELIPVIPTTPVSPMRQRLIDDMNMRHFSRETQRNYVRDVGRFATFLRTPLDTATAEDLRRFQIEQREAGMPVPTMNSIVAALRFFFNAERKFNHGIFVKIVCTIGLRANSKHWWSRGSNDTTAMPGGSMLLRPWSVSAALCWLTNQGEPS